MPVETQKDRKKLSYFFTKKREHFHKLVKNLGDQTKRQCEVKVFPVYIITNKTRIEKPSDKICHALTEKQTEALQRKYGELKCREYKLQCGQSSYEIICPEIKMEKSAKKYLIVPGYLIPGRPYPIYVYLYAIKLYASNPRMGQREAAEQTRRHFCLETFSHTTLGRAMKKLESLIKNTGSESGHKKSSYINEGQEGSGRGSFPSAEDTAERRRTVLLYLKEASGQDKELRQEALLSQIRPPYKGAFIDACHRIVEHAYKKYHHFLL